MSGPLGMVVQAAGLAVRTGWYLGLNRVIGWQTSRLGRTPGPRPSRPMPTLSELLADLARLHLRDAAAVRDGLYPPVGDEPSLGEALARAGAMLADVPAGHERRTSRDATSVRVAADVTGLPPYYAQDFHYQTGGYLTEQSARLYDVQVETLFYGAAGPMRRAALRPIAEYMRDRDQRSMRMLDVACGTGRFLRAFRLAWPAMAMSGLDLSPSYLEEAGRHLAGLRPVDLICANAETIPLPDDSVDIVTSVFLLHELPAEVRRTVVAEMARVLKPGGLMVIVDSLQMGDRPDWDGLLEAFPARFHEPYFREYTLDDLDRLMSDAGLTQRQMRFAFLAKVMTGRKGIE